ncbi:TetR/AcrR family transcriptional regulator [Cellulomonas chengniuliangii]|uniref:TetR family transcriptional regulator n=1 Tax=Cellulomonas chengniuliangii TaxID=2968084 RepID=A0ABY5L140_9CELL|nr:TetR family transcriptional regulator [Cellulomonas chengniuliangii]MCC2307427.1 TetR family transcriptional regulator [Cellulomonas chengniuliangii]MCC2318036.1 TetR family transcriptional regulator [Cellulomonas chengniuliangii]UUI75793.1 TetR family transcriptional regulator [Cellulomonas chengniuliangii]
MRADALRRREALIAAAREQFLLHGDAVALDAVAARAGVGIATLYRNFPTRRDLADATACAVLEDMQLAASEASATFAERPEATWHAFAERLVKLQLGSVIRALSHDPEASMSPQVAATQQRTEQAVEAVLAQARDAGLLREDLGATEFVLAVAKVSQPATVHAPDAFPGFGARLMAMLVAGMRPDGRPLPTPGDQG